MNTQTGELLTKMTHEGYARIADSFDKTRHYSWGDFSVFDSLVKDGMKILDIGCGNGRFFKHLASRAIEYVGIDANPRFVQIAQETYRNHPGQPRFFVGDIRTISAIPSLADQKFDIIFGIAVLHHIPTRAGRSQVLQDVKELLAVGGILVLENWNLWQLRKGTKTVWHSCAQRLSFKKLPWEIQYTVSRRRLGFADIITQWGSSSNRAFLYYHAFTLHELSGLCISSGYRIRDLYYIRDGKRAHWWNGKNIMVILDT